MGKALDYLNTFFTIAFSIVFFVLVIFMVMGCTETRIKYVQAELTHDPRPVLPKITGKELECLSSSTYHRLYERQRLIVDYAETLETIIDSTGGNK